MIKILKIGGNVYQNLELTVQESVEVEALEKVLELDENGKEVYVEKPITVTEYKDAPNPIIPTYLEELRTALIDTVKWQVGMKLKDTDWTVTKCMELGLNMSDKYPDIANERAILRAFTNDKELELLVPTTIDELMKVDIKL